MLWIGAGSVWQYCAVLCGAVGDAVPLRRLFVREIGTLQESPGILGISKDSDFTIFKDFRD